MKPECRSGLSRRGEIDNWPRRKHKYTITLELGLLPLAPQNRDPPSRFQVPPLGASLSLGIPNIGVPGRTKS